MAGLSILRHIVQDKNKNINSSPVYIFIESKIETNISLGRKIMANINKLINIPPSEDTIPAKVDNTLYKLLHLNA